VLERNKRRKKNKAGTTVGTGRCRKINQKTTNLKVLSPNNNIQQPPPPQQQQYTISLHSPLLSGQKQPCEKRNTHQKAKLRLAACRFAKLKENASPSVIVGVAWTETRASLELEAYDPLPPKIHTDTQYNINSGAILAPRSKMMSKSLSVPI
jgi:hypothetical protein